VERVKAAILLVDMIYFLISVSVVMNFECWLLTSTIG
jgi:hypothetical protein